MTASPTNCLHGYNAICLKCDSRYLNAEKDRSHIAIEVCKNCGDTDEKLKKKPKAAAVDFDFRRYLRRKIII